MISKKLQYYLLGITLIIGSSPFFIPFFLMYTHVARMPISLEGYSVLLLLFLGLEGFIKFHAPAFALIGIGIYVIIKARNQ